MPTLTTAPRTMMEKIISAACQYYGCSEDQLMTRKFTENRKIVCYLLRKEAMIKYSHIAVRFKLADHSWPTVMTQEIESQKDIYTHISHDIKNIMDIVATLV